MKNNNPKQFKGVKVYFGYGSYMADAEIREVLSKKYLKDLDIHSRNFVACQLEVPSMGCLDSCVSTTCPSTTVYYLLKCSDQCLLDDCQSVTAPSSEKCLDCLETCAPARCSTTIPVKMNYCTV